MPVPNTCPREEALRRMMAVRETAMAANVSWIVAREGVRGRVLVSAAEAHLMEAVDHAGKDDPLGHRHGCAAMAVSGHSMIGMLAGPAGS